MKSSGRWPVTLKHGSGQNWPGIGTQPRQQLGGASMRGGRPVAGGDVGVSAGWSRGIGTAGLSHQLTRWNAAGRAIRFHLAHRRINHPLLCSCAPANGRIPVAANTSSWLCCSGGRCGDRAAGSGDYGARRSPHPARRASPGVHPHANTLHRRARAGICRSALEAD